MGKFVLYMVYRKSQTNGFFFFCMTSYNEVSQLRCYDQLSLRHGIVMRHKQGCTNWKMKLCKIFGPKNVIIEGFQALLKLHFLACTTLVINKKETPWSDFLVFFGISQVFQKDKQKTTYRRTDLSIFESEEWLECKKVKKISSSRLLIELKKVNNGKTSSSKDTVSTYCI